MPITLRPATPADAPFVTLVLMEALTRNALQPDGSLKPEAQDTHRRLVPVTLRGDTLYSFRHATLAVDEGGTPVGGIIAYPGGLYDELQRTTFALIPDLLDFDPAQMDPEARPGEYYLDSLCVLPGRRGLGIGGLLLQRAIADGQARGLLPTLAVHPENLKARALYARQGFRPAGRYFIFGEEYLRMQVPVIG